MLFCKVCEKEVAPTLDMHESGKVLAICPTCTLVLGDGRDATDQPTPTPTAQVAKGDPAAPRKLAEPLDLVGEAKARLQVIDTELERLAGLQRERRRLAAMIDAAESADVEDNLALVVRRANDPPLATAAE